MALQQLLKASGLAKDNAEKVAVALLRPSIRSGAFSVNAQVLTLLSVMHFAASHGLVALTAALLTEGADVTLKVDTCMSFLYVGTWTAVSFAVLR